MTRKHLKAAFCIACAVSAFGGPEVAHADSGLLNLFGAVIEQSARQQQQQEQNNREQEQMIATIRQMQSDLAMLGFYAGKADGSLGPSTQAAMHSFQRAFLRPAGGIDRRDVEFLSQIAPTGFRSADEMQSAQAMGFQTRAEFLAARSGGFNSKYEIDQARPLGFTTHADYAAYQQSGFNDPELFRSALKGGFADPAEFQSARQAGFMDKASYTEFLSSGLTNKQQFLERKADNARKSASVASCMRLKARQDWVAAASACLNAQILAPDEGSIKAAAVAAIMNLGAVKDETKAEIDKVDSRISELAPQVRKKSAARETAALKRTVAALEDTLTRIGKLQLIGACVEAGAEEKWDTAVEACRSAAAGLPESGYLRERLTLAQSKIVDARAKADSEKRRLALSNLIQRAGELVTSVHGFSKSGGQFSEPLQIAKLLVGVEQVIGGDQPADIEAATTNLEAALDGESAYASYLKSTADAQRRAELAAADAARAAAERLNGFAQAYIGANLTSPHIAALLSLHDTLTAVLARGDLPSIVAAESAGTDQLRSMGLTGEFNAYRPTSAAAEAKLKDEAAEQHSHQIAIEAAQKSADALLQQVAAFTGQGGHLEGGLDTVRAIVNLKKARQDPSNEALLAALQVARAQLNAPAFQAYLQSQANILTNASNDSVVIAKHSIDDMLAFIADYSTANPLAPGIAELLDLQSTLSAALTNQGSTAILDAEAQGVSTIARLQLAPNLEANRLSKLKGPSPTEVASNGLAVTSGNRAILVGNALDILVFLNTTPTAPHIKVDIAGNRIFAEETARYCWLQSEFTPSVGTTLAAQSLYKAGAERLTGGGICDDPLEAYDAVLLQRGAFLGGEPARAKSFVEKFEGQHFKISQTLLAADQSAADKARESTSDAIEKSVYAGQRLGFGVIRLSGNALPICVDPNGNSEAAEKAVEHHFDEISDLLPSRDFSIVASLPDIFQKSLKGECSAVLADSEQLRELMAGLKRQQTNYLFVPIWFEQDEISRIAGVLQANSDADKQAATRSEQDRTAQAALENEQRQNAAQTTAKHQQELRAQYSQASRAAFNKIDGLSKPYFESDSGSFAQLFPTIAQWWTGLRGQLWQMETYGSELADYGTGEWKGRRVEVVAAQISIRLKNGPLGEYKSTCWITGFLIDAEFDQIRDPLEAECADAQALQAWKTGHKFDSRWIVQ